MSFAYAAWHPAAEEPLPTVIALHGHGAHAQDLLGLAPHLADGRVLMICPQAEFEVVPGALAFTWFRRDANNQRPIEEIERVAAGLRTFIDEIVPRCGGDPTRVAIMGFSQGGTLAYRLGLAEPSRFLGVAALSTYFPDDVTGTVDTANVASLPLLVQHGTHDAMIEVARAHASRDLVQTLGAQPEYLEYPMEHEINRQSLTDLSTWLTRVFGLAAVTA
ncbi:MAG: hypothetical protein DWI58_20525 [Chloroflexi bacterium]|nr:MAG: hypothetical protein DWI58_20525 [Chloroflexota bacterium]